jgi:hypothetical protein
LEPLEQRTLLSITPRLVPGGVSFLGDGVSDVLTLRATPSNQLAYSIDGSPFSTDLGGGALSLASKFAIAVDTGGGGDRLEVDASLRSVLDSGGGTLSDHGGSGLNTLSGGDTGSTWWITGINAGRVGGITFTDVQNLVGGLGQDTFALAGQAGVDSTIDGGGGYNVLDYSAYTTQVSVDLSVGRATGARSVRNIQDATGLPSASLTGVPQWQPVGPSGTTSGDSSSDGAPILTEPGVIPGVDATDSVGPTESTGGPVEGMQAQGNPVSGAVTAIAVDPTDPNIIYVGTTNGGIWKTTNAQSGQKTVDVRTFYDPRRTAAPEIKGAGTTATATDTSDQALPPGTYRYKITFVDGNTGAESNASDPITVEVEAGQEVRLKNIPLGPVGTVARRIYRTPPNGNSYGLITSIDNNKKQYNDSETAPKYFEDTAADPVVLVPNSTLKAAPIVAATQALATTFVGSGPLANQGIEAGNYQYRITFVDSNGNETPASSPGAVAESGRYPAACCQ